MGILRFNPLNQGLTTMWGYIPKMTNTTDKAKIIAAFVVLVASIIFSDKVDSGNEELITAIAVLVSYVIGLYSETYNNKGDKSDE